MAVEERAKRASAREQRHADLHNTAMYCSLRSRRVRYLTLRAARAAWGCRDS